MFQRYQPPAAGQAQDAMTASVIVRVHRLLFVSAALSAPRRQQKHHAQHSTSQH